MKGLTRTSGLAIAAFVLAIVPTFVGQILAIIFGIMSLRIINKSQGRLMGKGLAIAALILAPIFLFMEIAVSLLFIPLPLYSAQTTDAIMSEGVAGCGVIRSTLRVYYSRNGTYSGATLPTATTAGNLEVVWGDLQGKYFAQGDYSITGLGASTYTITAGPPTLTTKVQFTYIINQEGKESGTYKTDQ